MLTGNSVTLLGHIRVSAGSLQIGNGNNESLLVNGGSVFIDGGNLSVAGRLARSGLTSRISFSLSSGNLVLGTSGSTTGGEAIFRLDEQGSSFSMTGGNFTMRRSGASNLGLVNTNSINVVVTGGTVFVGDASTPASQIISINSSVPINHLIIGNGVVVSASLLTNSLNVLNDISIESGTFVANNLPIELQGNWNNDAVFTAGTSSVIFNGSLSQNISGTSTTTFNTLVISNLNATGVNCLAPVNVTGSLNLNSGKLNTDAINILTMESTSGSSAGSVNSHVNGPMQKIGTTAFVFPVGKGGRWARVGIGAPSSSSTFFAEYFNTGFGNYGGTPTQTPPLNNVSRLEYWNLDRLVGTGNAAVSLYWEDSNFSDINDCSNSDLRIAHWNTGSSQWENNNNSVTTAGTCTGSSAGFITTNAVVTAFSPFTFGSLSSFVNPLPVELIQFTGQLNNVGETELQWTTATEISNDYFTLQRSRNGKDFEWLVDIDAAGTSYENKKYDFVDREPFEGINYYRLKQMDFDQSYTYSKIISVVKEEEVQFSIYPNPTQDKTIFISFGGELPELVSVYIYDAAGREVFQQNIKCAESGASFTMPLVLKEDFIPGMYSVKIISSHSTYNSKLVVLASE